MTDQTDGTPEVIEDVAPQAGADCGEDDDVTDVCWDDANYATCTDGQWLVRPCPSGTTCITSDTGVPSCGFPDD